MFSYFNTKKTQLVSADGEEDTVDPEETIQPHKIYIKEEETSSKNDGKRQGEHRNKQGGLWPPRRAFK